MRISLRQLEAFFWTARLGSLHAAARHLNVSQPAVSTRIRELEATLNLQLFARQNQRVRLTPEGRHAVAYAERALSSVQEFERLGRTGKPLEGLLRLGSDESTAIMALSEILRQLKQLHPGLIVEITIDVGSVLQEKLRKREIDIALHTTAGSSSHVVDQLLGWVEFVWVAATGMAIPDGPFTPLTASRLPIVTNSAPSTLNGLVQRWLRSGGIEFDGMNSCNSLSLMLRLVREAHAIAILPLPVLRELIADGTVRCLPASPSIQQVAYYASYVVDEADEDTFIVVDIAGSVLLKQRFITRLAEGAA